MVCWYVCFVLGCLERLRLIDLSGLSDEGLSGLCWGYGQILSRVYGLQAVAMAEQSGRMGVRAARADVVEQTGVASRQVYSDMELALSLCDVHRSTLGRLNRCRLGGSPSSMPL